MNLYIQLLEFTGSIVQAWTELGHMFFFNQAFYQILILFNIMSILFNIYILKSYLSPCTLLSCRVKLCFLVNSCPQNWHGKLASSFKWIILICCWRVSILVKVLPQSMFFCYKRMSWQMLFWTIHSLSEFRICCLCVSGGHNELRSQNPHLQPWLQADLLHG